MSKIMRSRLLQSLSCLAMLLVTGCAQLTMGPPAASIDNTMKLRAANPAPVSVGKFTPAPGLGAGLDVSLSIRGGNSVNPPTGGSFSQYLGETLAAELRGAGLLDPGAGIVISGALTKNELSTAGSGSGALGARFVVTREGVVRFERELTVTANWESSFIASIAVPAAALEYQGLYRKLVTALLDDADFRKAIAR